MHVSLGLVLRCSGNNSLSPAELRTGWLPSSPQLRPGPVLSRLVPLGPAHCPLPDCCHPCFEDAGRTAPYRVTKAGKD